MKLTFEVFESAQGMRILFLLILILIFSCQNNSSNTVFVYGKEIDESFAINSEGKLGKVDRLFGYMVETLPEQLEDGKIIKVSYNIAVTLKEQEILKLISDTEKYFGVEIRYDEIRSKLKNNITYSGSMNNHNIQIISYPVDDINYKVVIKEFQIDYTEIFSDED